MPIDIQDKKLNKVFNKIKIKKKFTNQVKIFLKKIFYSTTIYSEFILEAQPTKLLEDILILQLFLK